MTDDPLKQTSMVGFDSNNRAERMEKRLDEAMKRWAQERKNLLADATAWRDKAAELSEKWLSSEGTIIRQAAAITRLRQLLEYLNRQGGLGLDVHEAINNVLAEVNNENSRRR